MSDICPLCDKIERLARFLMGSKGMPPLVINAPEDDDDLWRVYPSGYAAIGIGETLSAAIDDAYSHPLVSEIPGAKP